MLGSVHSTCSLKSDSPSFDDLNYKMVHHIRKLRGYKSRFYLNRNANLRVTNMSPVVNVYVYTNGQRNNNDDEYNNYYKTYRVRMKENPDSSFYSRPGPSPKSVRPCSTQEFVPGSMASAFPNNMIKK